jgi:hypothetical protein
MGHPLGHHGRLRGVVNRTPLAAWATCEAGWQLYPVYAVDDEGTCACPKGQACPHPGKHPTTPRGFNDASSDPERIAELFTRWPGGNVGLKTGRASGTIIIDVDPRHGGMETLGRLQAEHGYLPPTRMHATGGGGFHYALRYPEGMVEVPSRAIGPGVEVKANGAGVVMPPSNHASGGRYALLLRAPLAPLPPCVAEIPRRELRVLAGGAEPPTESRFKLPERIYETASPSAASRDVLGNRLGRRLGSLVRWSCMDGSRQARAPRGGCSSFGHLPTPRMCVALIRAMLLSTLEPNGERTP